MKAGYVAITGKPNVGKSTLLNSLMGCKVSITSKKAQTTQRNVLAVLDRSDTQIAFIDTPGLHQGKSHRFYRHLNDMALSGCEGVDVMLYVCHAHGWREEDAFALKRLGALSIPVVVAVNKIDKLDKGSLLQQLSLLQSHWPDTDLVPISALKNKNIDNLIDVISHHLPEQPQLFEPGDLVAQEEEHILELVREKVFRLTAQEVPYETSFTLRHQAVEKGIRHIYIDIGVRKPGQKSILLGQGGASIKRIGTAARQDLEKYLGIQVCLKLWVKLSPERTMEQAIQSRSQFLCQSGTPYEQRDPPGS